MKIYDLFIKNRFSKFWAVSSIFDLFQLSKKFTVPSKWWKLFFFEYVEWGIKKSGFLYWFQKCTCDLSKKCTQKKF